MYSGKTAVNYKFERIEKKFWLSEAQYLALLPLFDKMMNRDEYGVSAICNIYYDTQDYMLIRRSIERPYFKEKLRLRSYGIPQDKDPVFVEIKRKLDGIGYKRRIRVPFDEAKRLLRGVPVHCGNPQIEGELLEFIRRYRPEPKVFLMYQRYAMTARGDKEFRVTIDKNLRYRASDAENPHEGGMKPIMADESKVLMEIKAPGAIPSWFAGEMSRLKIYQAPFSKIGTCYTNHIAPLTQYSDRKE